MANQTTYQAGATDVTTYWVCYDTTTNAIDETGVAYNATGLRLTYVLPRASEVTAVVGGGTAPASLAADDTAHTDWGFRHIGYGIHRVDWPDAALASGDFTCLLVGGVADKTFVMIPSIDLTGVNPRSATVVQDIVDGVWEDDTSARTTDDSAGQGLSFNVSRLHALMPEFGTIGATGNDTTHVHLPDLTGANDVYNDRMLILVDSSTGVSASRWILDWVNSSKLATVATLPFTPEASADPYWLTTLRQDVTGGSGLDAAGVRAAVGLASANLDMQLGDLPTNADLATALSTADDAVLAAIAALNNLSAAQVNAEVLDVLNTDTTTPPTAAPAANASMKAILAWLLMKSRNRITQTATTQTLYADDGTTPVATSTVSDDTTTAVRGEFS